MDHLTTILLTQYKSGGEAILVGLLQGLVIWGAVSLFRGAKKAVNGKKFEEVKNDVEKKSDNPETK
ncbi:hypothetical protein [Aquirufa antheringensis]|jgi:hypothetical protein|uniref:hypothetical protein n=1 Tax=Aquirufa antheringensis TaxID=2516559 RepID=UPI00208EC52A|nr:hypothetical protein [Aquirufa antheringensis]USQ03890.1 hypothetical protein G9X63_07125 [Aquirufa antheringensis]